MLGYALVEARMPVLRRRSVPVLARGQEPITILHLSDLHLTDRTQARVDWVRGLAELHPDVVVNTGDNLSFASGLLPLGQALEPFLGLPGAFVMGDHDYHSTVFKLPTRYLRADPRSADSPEDAEDVEALPWRAVRDLQASGGWADLGNARGTLEVRGRSIELVGVDDPHADRDAYPEPASSPDDVVEPVRNREGRPLRLGLTHAPYRRVLDAMSRDDVDLAMAGHTHGGQLCVPGYGALVTNCDLDAARASGLSRYPGRMSDPAAADHMFLHVSAGLGTSPYTPVRLACRPEATLLTLVPAS
nr:metallophosphoesterase [Actinomyces urogenitalis]